MGGIELNKIAAAVLLAGIVAMVAGIGSEALYHGGMGHHGDEEEVRGYSIEVTEETPGGESESAEASGPVDIAPFFASANLENGKALLGRCTTCHSFEKGGKEGVGPNQYGLIGRGVASHSAYTRYSDGLLAHKGETWTFQKLSEFLENPKKAIPGNSMQYRGLKKPQDRADLIAYINATFSDSPKPLP